MLSRTIHTSALAHSALAHSALAHSALCVVCNNISNNISTRCVVRGITTTSSNGTVMYAPTEMEQQNETLTRELREAYIRIDTLNSEVNELTKEVKELTELLKECHYRLERKCTPIKGIV